MEETILAYLQRRLKEVGSAHWEALAEDARVGKTLPRKVVYERSNPGVNTIEPLYRYLQDVDAGKRTLPWERPAKVRPARKAKPGAH